MKVNTFSIALWLLSFLLIGCSKEVGELELKNRFYQNEATFISISQTACSLLSDTGKSVFDYNKGDYSNRNSIFSSFSLDSTPKPNYYLTIDRLDDYAANVIQKVESLDRLLTELNLEEVAIRNLSGKCRIFSKVWGWGMNGEGQIMMYAYQPENIYSYDPLVHSVDVRELKSEIDFTIPLSTGWFIYYTNTP